MGNREQGTPVRNSRVVPRDTDPVAGPAAGPHYRSLFPVPYSLLLAPCSRCERSRLKPLPRRSVGGGGARALAGRALARGLPGLDPGRLALDRRVLARLALVAAHRVQ